MASEEQRTVLRRLAEVAAKPFCRFLEVGSWCGDSTVILGKVAQKYGGHVFCVDWWKGNAGTELEEIANKIDVFSFFWNRICHEHLEEVVVPIRARSDVVSEILEREKFDLVFLDGDHRYEGVLKDIRNYAPLVRRKGGILCGHDCEGRVSDFDINVLEFGKDNDIYEGIHCGVVLAVGSMFKEYSIDCGIWSVRATGQDNNWEPTNLVYPGIDATHVSPPLLIGSYKGYNLIRYRGNVHALLQALGHIDLYLIDEHKLREYQNKGMYAIGGSVEEVKHLVERYVQPSDLGAHTIKSAQDFILMRKFVGLGLRCKDAIGKIPILNFIVRKIYTP